MSTADAERRDRSIPKRKFSRFTFHAGSTER